MPAWTQWMSWSRTRRRCPDDLILQVVAVHIHIANGYHEAQTKFLLSESTMELFTI